MLNTLFRHHPIHVHTEHLAHSTITAPSAELAEEHGFIRHPEGFPLTLVPTRSNDTVSGERKHSDSNTGIGLLLHLDKKLPLGSEFIVQIPLRNEEYTFHAKLVYMKKLQTSYEAGLWLREEEDVIQLRVIEQICRMEDYLNQKKQSDESVVNMSDKTVFAA